jgi:hypothetical protein
VLIFLMARSYIRRYSLIFFDMKSFVCSRFRAMRVSTGEDVCLYCGKDFRSHLESHSLIVLSNSLFMLYIFCEN